MRIKYGKELSEEEDIINFWSSLGFLEGLNGFNKKHTALAYDRISKHLDKNINGDEKFESTIYPVIRRIIGGLAEVFFYSRGSNETEDEAKRMYLIKNLDVVDILNNLIDSYDELIRVVERLNKNNEIDLEAETVALFCDIKIRALSRILSNYDIFIKKNGEDMLFTKIK